MKQESNLPFDEMEWVEFDTEGNGVYQLGRVIYVDEEQQKVAVQISGKIGPSAAVVDAQLVDWSSARIRKTTQSHLPPVMDNGPLAVGCFVDVSIHKTTFKAKPCLQWWPAVIEAVEDGVYTVRCDSKDAIAKREAPWREKFSEEDAFRKAAEAGRKEALKMRKADDGLIVTDLVREDIRVVCNCEDCRRHNFVLTLPQLWCVRCQNPLRQPNTIWHMHTDDEMRNPLHFCTPCHKALSKSPEECRNTEIKLKLLKPINLQMYKEIRMPKQPSYHEGEPGPVPEGTPGEDIGKSAPYVQCGACQKWYHWPCAMYNDKIFYKPRWTCQACNGDEEGMIQDKHRAKCLMQTEMSQHMEHEVRNKLKALHITHPPIRVRVISSLKNKLLVPEALRLQWGEEGPSYPAEFEFMSKSIMVFQDLGDCDVCLFSMYVQEYGLDCPEPNKGRCYISYLDSVRFFQCTDPKDPEAHHRSDLYHEIMASYLGFIRNFGFTKVHIWVEPPKPYDEYIFFGRPAQDKKVMERHSLRRWYNKMLEKCKAQRIVERYNNMYDEFPNIKSAREIPIFKGDQWETTLQELVGKKTANGKASGVAGHHELGLARQDTASLLKHTKKSIQTVSDHFLVATLRPIDKKKKKADVDPIISYHSTNKREDFLELCVKNSWEFRSLQHAKWSTMNICHHLMTSPKPDQCLDSCSRGRVDDGYGMIACDGTCNRWYHYECVNLDADAAKQEDTWFCDDCKFAALVDQGDYDMDTLVF